MTKLLSIDIERDGKTMKFEIPEETAKLLLELQESGKLSENDADFIVAACSYSYSCGWTNCKEMFSKWFKNQGIELVPTECRK